MTEAPASFDAFVVARGPALLRFAYLVTHDRALAEDLVQEALVKAHRHWGRVVAAEHPEAYVRRIVLNEATNWRRRRSSTETPGPVPELALAGGQDAVAERDQVWQAIAGLPARQRAVLVLRFYEDRSESEIAQLLGCAQGTVRSLAARAFEALRRDPQLARDGGPAPSTRGEQP